MIKIREEIFKYYFYFIQERMNIFWKKQNGDRFPWTDDSILRKFRFTNVYRAIDRVSQYLIKQVIYSNLQLTEEDILLRILIFKIFNKIETWEYIKDRIGQLTLKNYNPKLLSEILSERRLNFPIFNNAYMMPGTHSLYEHKEFKHEKWLQMVQDEFISGKILFKIVNSKSLEDVYNMLKECSFIGEFLAYQYAIDFNYSPVFTFSENSYVKAGIGAIRGLKKCFKDISKKDYENAIYFTLENFEKFQVKFGYNNVKLLDNRQPTLIDLQNCFCETDKYLRGKMPELVVQNTRIKQKYSPMEEMSPLFFPPKWRVKLR